MKIKMKSAHKSYICRAVEVASSQIAQISVEWFRKKSVLYNTSTLQLIIEQRYNTHYRRLAFGMQAQSKPCAAPTHGLHEMSKQCCSFQEMRHGTTRKPYVRPWDLTPKPHIPVEFASSHFLHLSMWKLVRH